MNFSKRDYIYPNENATLYITCIHLISSKSKNTYYFHYYPLQRISFKTSSRI